MAVEKINKKGNKRNAEYRRTMKRKRIRRERRAAKADPESPTTLKCYKGYE